MIEIRIQTSTTTGMKNDIKTIKYTTLLLFAAAVASCGKTYDLNGMDWDPDNPASDSVFNREIQIYDLGVNNVPESHVPLDGQDPMFFSLEKFSSVGLAYRTTDRWDIAMKGLYRSSIVPNNGKQQGVGYGSSAQGGIVLLDSAYSEVRTIPDDSRFAPYTEIGLAGFADELYPSGHVFYTFFGNIFRPDKMANLGSGNVALETEANRYMHMVYCMSEDFAKAYPGEYGDRKIKIKPRTLIIRTARGNYAKIETQSFYKGIMDPKNMYRGSDRPVPYLSFHYMVVKKDEKRFGFVARKPKLTVNLTTKKTTVGN